MSMFEELFALASHATLTLIVSADAASGRMTVSVIPKPKDDNGEAALRQPLSLTATPHEFDAEFLDALRDYREVRASLADQAAATKEVLEAANPPAGGGEVRLRLPLSALAPEEGDRR